MERKNICIADIDKEYYVIEGRKSRKIERTEELEADFEAIQEGEGFSTSLEDKIDDISSKLNSSQQDLIKLTTENQILSEDVKALI